MNTGTQAIPGHSGQHNGQRGGKKTQWKKFNLASGQLVLQVKEQSSISGRKTYKYGLFQLLCALKIASAFANIFSGPPANAFYLFPELPVEMRFKIWGYTALHSRFIEIG